MQKNWLWILLRGTHHGKTQIQLKLWKCAIFQPKCWKYKRKFQIQILLQQNRYHPTVLDAGNEIILANWPNDKHIIYNINNDIPIKIPSHPYVLVNRSVLCNCGIEVENHFLLKSLAACQDTNSKLTMYFTVNTAFVNYLDKFPNLTVSWVPGYQK